MAQDISDIVIKGPNDPGYVATQLENVTFLDTVIAKIYMILMTNKGDVLGDPNFGGDIPKYLWQTKFPAATLQSEIQSQFATYIPELSTGDYKISVSILPGSQQDLAVIGIDLGLASVNILFK
jgi:hypothetical protein